MATEPFALIPSCDVVHSENYGIGARSQSWLEGARAMYDLLLSAVLRRFIAAEAAPALVALLHDPVTPEGSRAAAAVPGQLAWLRAVGGQEAGGTCCCACAG